MSTMAENVISVGAANRPPMLERSQYDSWKSRMLLYIRATPTTPASTRVRTIDDLTEAEKIHEAYDIRATNIVLQGLLPDVYTLVKHHTVFKEIWDIVKFLIEDVKLTKDMHNSSFNQLYAYLRQHEVHANEVQNRSILNNLTFVDDLNIDITSDINVISYDQYEKENKNEGVQDTTFSEQQDAVRMSIIEEMPYQVAKCNVVNQENKTVNESLTIELERYKEMVKFFKERHKFDLNDREKYIDSQMGGIIIDRNAKVVDFQKQIQTLKLQLSANFESHKNLSTTVAVLKKETKEKQDKYIEEFVDLEKKKKALENIVYKQGHIVQTMHMLTKP
ncbi:hypothetical protein Tco_0677512 [Tanacetum coccineum]|uniref:Integrase, catalytic region, zinc finger, CCHC-type, peptidase aspartic, catalytic n=1 Tax=Tanacetum coccineum TaxID=301880 RepID=A0ABQ4XD96_9ASTR